MDIESIFASALELDGIRFNLGRCFARQANQDVVQSYMVQYTITTLSH